MNFKIAAVSIAFLAGSGAAQAQMQPNTTPTGAAVPSAQQVTGRASDANGRDQPQPNSNSTSSADHSLARDKATPSPAVPTK